MSIKCEYCGTEAINSTTDKELKVCCCYMLHKRDTHYIQHHKDGSKTYPIKRTMEVRDFIYKAISKDTKEWVTGYLTRHTYHNPDGSKTNKHYISCMDIWLDEDGIPMSQSGMCVEVDGDTICQFTGIYDGTPWEVLPQTEQEEFLFGGNEPSDWCGKPIFTSDILENGVEVLVCVRRKADFILKKKNGRPQTLTIVSKCRVVGNLLDKKATGGVKKLGVVPNEFPY